LKSEWQSELEELSRFKETDAPVISESDIEDEPQPQPLVHWQPPQEAPQDFDDMMVDIMAQQEENEVDALISSFIETPTSVPQIQISAPTPRPDLPSISEDEEYEQLFMEMIMEQESAKQQQQQQTSLSWGQMDMS
jgi:hypothetical protein